MGIFSKTTGGGSGDPESGKPWNHNPNNKHKGEKPPAPQGHNHGKKPPAPPPRKGK